MKRRLFSLLACAGIARRAFLTEHLGMDGHLVSSYPALWSEVEPAALEGKHLLARCPADGQDSILDHGLMKFLPLSRVSEGRFFQVINDDGELSVLKETSLRRKGEHAGASRVHSRVELKHFAKEVANQERAARIGVGLPILDAWACEPSGREPAIGYMVMPSFEGRLLPEAINSPVDFNGDQLEDSEVQVECKSISHSSAFGSARIEGNISVSDELKMIDALTKANEAGVMPMDFDPRNAFIDSHGRFKLMDFRDAAGVRMPCSVVHWVVRERLNCKSQRPSLQDAGPCLESASFSPFVVGKALRAIVHGRRNDAGKTRD